MLKYSIPEEQWYLEGNTNDNRKWVIPIDKNPFTIGRSEDCNLSLLSQTVSRKHAEIFYRGNSVFIRDLNSTNGTFINEKRIKDRILLNNGDTIYFGDLKFRILLKAKKRKDENSDTMYLKLHKEKGGFTEYYNLTKREEEILYYLLQGKSTKKIANALYISFGTAKNHVSNIFKKIGVHSRYELIALFNSFSMDKN